MNAEISETIKATGIGHADSWDSCAAQFFLSRVPLPLQRPETGRIEILTEMYCSYQYLSIVLKQICLAHFNAHKLQKIVNMNVDISETIKDRELGSQI